MKKAFSRGAEVGTSAMKQSPMLLSERAFHAPNRGRDALAPGIRRVRATAHGASFRPRTAVRSAVGSRAICPIGTPPVPCTSAPDSLGSRLP